MNLKLGLWAYARYFLIFMRHYLLVIDRTDTDIRTYFLIFLQVINFTVNFARTNNHFLWIRDSFINFDIFLFYFFRIWLSLKSSHFIFSFFFINSLIFYQLSLHILMMLVLCKFIWVFLVLFSYDYGF